MDSIGLESISIFARGLDHPEGIAVSADGVVFAGGEAGQIYRIALDGSAEVVADTGGFNLGLCFNRNGELLIADVGNTTVWSWTSHEGLIQRHTASAELPLVHPNAFADSRHGTYFSDSGKWKSSNGSIWLMGHDFEPRQMSTEVNRFPNGMAMSPSGEHLYVVESNFGVVRLGVNPDGELGPREPVIALSGQVPDGIAFSPQGELYVSFYQPNLVGRLTDEGTWETVLHDPEAQVLAMPTNIAFLPDGRLIIANLGGWHIAVSNVSALR
jgi:gluconolactonase